MPIRDFPFISLYPGHPPNVWLPINITNPHTGLCVSTYGLIDTGAYSCAIPGFIAQNIGHDIRAGRKKPGSGADGDFDGWEHQIEIDILSQNGTVLHKINAGPTQVIERLPIVLLGVDKFLNDFHLQVHYPNRMFSITCPS